MIITASYTGRRLSEDELVAVDLLFVVYQRVSPQLDLDGGGRVCFFWCPDQKLLTPNIYTPHGHKYVDAGTASTRRFFSGFMLNLLQRFDPIQTRRAPGRWSGSY